jgi:hypothetical protein
MPTFDCTFVGKLILPEVSTGPVPPGPGIPPGYWGGYRPPYVDIGGPGPQPVPPGYWGGVAPPMPTHPIAPGGPPPGYWGGVAPPLPTHPIAPGGPPPGYWGGVAPPHTDIGGPGPQPVPPGYWGGGNVPMPSPPIYLPPSPASPPGSPPIAVQLPVFPWSPQHPIDLPPEVLPPETPDGRPVDWKTAWTPQTGWVVVGIPTVPVPTPSGP